MTLIQDLNVEKRSCASRQFANAQRQNVAGQGEQALFVLEIPDSGLSPEDSYSQGERRQILFSAMNELPRATRRAIQLRELDERSTKETARIMGISAGAVKARVFHGRRKLRRVLQRESAGMSDKQSASGKANGLSRHQLVCSFGD